MLRNLSNVLIIKISLFKALKKAYEFIYLKCHLSFPYIKKRYNYLLPWDGVEWQVWGLSGRLNI